MFRWPIWLLKLVFEVFLVLASILVVLDVVIAELRLWWELRTGRRFRALLPGCTTCGGVHIHEAWPRAGTAPWVGPAHDNWPPVEGS